MKKIIPNRIKKLTIEEILESGKISFHPNTANHQNYPKKGVAMVMVGQNEFLIRVTWVDAVLNIVLAHEHCGLLMSDWEMGVNEHDNLRRTLEKSVNLRKMNELRKLLEL